MIHKMKIFSFIFILLLLSTCVTISSPSNNIIDKLKIEGKPYFEQLVESQEYDGLLDKIESGDDFLIREAAVLSQWADASIGLSLRFTLSRAIIKNPDAVMSLVPETFSVDELCTIPYIEEPKTVELNHIEMSIAALENSSTSTIAHSECLNNYMRIM